MSDAKASPMKVKMIGGPCDGRETESHVSDCVIVPGPSSAVAAVWCAEGEYLSEPKKQFEEHKYYRLVDGNYHYAGLYVPPPYVPSPPKQPWFKRLFNWWRT